VRHVLNGSADPKSRQMRGTFRHTNTQRTYLHTLLNSPLSSDWLR